MEGRRAGRVGVEPEEGVDQQLGGRQEQVDSEQGKYAANERGATQQGAPLAAPRLTEAEKGSEQAVRLVLAHYPVSLDPRGVQPESGQRTADEKAHA